MPFPPQHHALLPPNGDHNESLPPKHAAPTAPSLQRSLSRQAISRLNSIRRDRKRSPARAWDDPRPDSATLNDQPRIMTPARAYTIARTNLGIRNNNRRLSPFPSVRPQPKPFPSPTHSPYLISKPIGPPYYPAADQFGRHHHSNSSSSSTGFTMHPETPYPRPDWLSGLRAGLRLLIVALSASVVGLLLNTLQIFRGNNYLDLQEGELPMPWPARTNMLPTAILLTIAAVNFFASFVVLVLSFKRSFRTPLRSRDLSRVLVGGLSITFWVSALLAYGVINNSSKASLGHFACTNRDTMTNGKYQYRTVCGEQTAAFYLAIAATFAETLTLVSLVVSSFRQTHHPQHPLEKPLLNGGMRSP
jgi:hypothetical protein